MSTPDIFDTLSEVARVLDPGCWMLVGGLMVHAHSNLAGVPNPRATDDADIVLEVGVTRYADAAARLQSIGFDPHNPLDHREPAYRFDRGREHIDLMVPDRITGIRFRQRDVLSVPGSGSAIKRTQLFRLPNGLKIRIPDLFSALSLKGAAYRTPSDDPVRHLRDGVVMLACTEGRDDLRPPSKSMQANINYLLQGLERPEAWSGIARGVSEKALRGIRQHFRPDWTPPIPPVPERARARIRRDGPSPT